MLFKKVLYAFNAFLHRKTVGKSNDCSLLFEKYSSFIETNKDLNYTCFEKNLAIEKKAHSFVGAVEDTGSLYLIPNDYKSICVIKKSERESFVGDLGDDTFKYTGECVYKNRLVLFPRKSKEYIILYLDSKTIEMVSNGESGNAEHHYGGVCTTDGIIFQPPRSNNNIAVFDLNTKKITRINIGPKYLKYRYCGSIIHPNGFIYFLPEHGHVLKINQKTHKWSFIGKRIDSMVFDAKIGTDGDIYGFSGYGKGILKIDVLKDRVVTIHDDIYFGSYGTKLGINGKLFSIPGNSTYVWEYNPIDNSLKKIYQTSERKWECKYAGGTTAKDGMVYASPVSSNKLLVLNPNSNLIIPDDIYNSFFSDNY